ATSATEKCARRHNTTLTWQYANIAMQPSRNVGPRAATAAAPSRKYAIESVTSAIDGATAKIPAKLFGSIISPIAENIVTIAPPSANRRTRSAITLHCAAAGVPRRYSAAAMRHASTAASAHAHVAAISTTAPGARSANAVTTEANA